MKHRIALLSLAVVPLLSAASRPPAAPDLVPAFVGGSGTQVTIRVRNQGTAASPAGLLNLSLGQPIGANSNHAMPALAAGAVNSVIINVGKPVAGVHYVVRLDVNQAIAELNENNNVASGNF
ncbi:MAG TPA: CARDB domain-containing protein [Longimicrobium sp.]|nr:CARDB domain-containing protein [Longimicrobium sp.]